MNLNDIVASGGIGALLLLSLIQISPIKLNPWTAIAKAFGEAVTGGISKDIKEVKTEVVKIREDVTALDAQFREEKAITARTRILRFGDEVSHGVHHSRDHFQSILQDIDDYDRYCEKNPGFKNHMTRLTSEKIIDIYKRLDTEGGFSE